MFAKYLVGKGLPSLIHLRKRSFTSTGKRGVLNWKNRQRAQRGKLQKKNKHRGLRWTLPAPHNEFHFPLSNWRRLKTGMNSL